jgi:hypothetical protein
MKSQGLDASEAQRTAAEFGLSFQLGEASLAILK